ncbi:MAG: hypothetical protein H6748_02160 [Spirochaetaceae bacterium]|nr:hypothetical protein [Spirochaetaceae bacterium]HPG25395.1 hypothetical protein [Myxococcota bacterium]
MSLDPPRRFDPDEPLVLDPDPVSQWLDWEEQANLVGFRTSTAPVAIDVVRVPREALEIEVLPGAPETIVRRFVHDDHVSFPRHPLNRDPGVAFFDAPVAERWTARFTSSRTLALPGPESGSALASLKLATDHPHPDFHQPEKTRLREEAVDAIRWARTIARIDALLEPPAGFAVIGEVLVVLVRGGESGFLVRDLRRFQGGHYFLPALSLPWVGHPIARARGEDFARFWGRHYAEAVGRAKARLFLRYGLFYETPNPQNLLVELDSGLSPTGTIVCRDVGDGLCGTDAFTAEGVPWTRLESDLRPETRNSFWAFGEAGDHSLGEPLLLDWYARHDRAYEAELARCLPTLARATDPAGTDWLEHWNRVLREDRATPALEAAFRRMGRPSTY